MRRASVDNASGAGVGALGVLADDHEVTALGGEVRDRGLYARQQPDWTQVDVLVERGPQTQQQAAFQNAGWHVRCAHGAEQYGIVVPELVEHGVGQHLTGTLVPSAAKVVGGGVDVEVEPGRGDTQCLDGLGRHLGPHSVAWDQCDLETYHVRPPRAALRVSRLMLSDCHIGPAPPTVTRRRFADPGSATTRQSLRPRNLSRACANLARYLMAPPCAVPSRREV